MVNRWSLDKFDDWTTANPVDNWSSRKLQPPKTGLPIYRVVVDPLSVVIGDTAIGTASNWYPVRITNTGLRKVLLRDVTITFPFTLKERWENQQLLPGQVVTIYVGVTPKDAILYNGTLKINTNQGLSFTVALKVQAQNRSLTYNGRVLHNGRQQYNGEFNNG